MTLGATITYNSLAALCTAKEFFWILACTLEIEFQTIWQSVAINFLKMLVGCPIYI